jgi:hypothetical protein
MKQIVEYTKATLTQEQLKTGYYGCTAAQMRKLAVAMVGAFLKGGDFKASTLDYPKDHLALFVMPEQAFEYPYPFKEVETIAGPDPIYRIDMEKASLAGLVLEIFETIAFEEHLIVRLPGFCTLDQLSVLFNTVISTAVAASTRMTNNEGRLLNPVRGHCFNPANAELVERMLHYVAMNTFKMRQAAFRYPGEMMLPESIQLVITAKGRFTDIGFLPAGNVVKIAGLVSIDHDTGDFKLARGVKTCLDGFPSHLKYITKDEDGYCFAKSRPHPSDKTFSKGNYAKRYPHNQ